MRACKDCGSEDMPSGRAWYCSDCNTSCEDHSTMTKNCRPCKRAYRKKRGITDVEREGKRRHARRSLYGLTDEELTELESIKNCEVCGVADRLVIDHNHDTGAVRGVICTNCNVALGNAKDGIERLLALANYLKERGSYGA